MQDVTINITEPIGRAGSEPSHRLGAWGADGGACAGARRLRERGLSLTLIDGLLRSMRSYVLKRMVALGWDVLGTRGSLHAIRTHGI